MTVDTAINESHVSDNPYSVATAARCWMEKGLLTLENDAMVRVFCAIDGMLLTQ